MLHRGIQLGSCSHAVAQLPWEGIQSNHRSCKYLSVSAPSCAGMWEPMPPAEGRAGVRTIAMVRAMSRRKQRLPNIQGQ